MSLQRSDYQGALDVQDGCNLSGIVFAFARVMQTICDEARVLNKGTDWKNTHPIAVMYASKIASLTRCEDLTEFEKAYEAILSVLKG